MDFSWRDIMYEIKDFIKEYLISEKEIVKDGFREMLEKEWQRKKDSGEIDDVKEKIIEIIDQHVKPWIEQDGGGIEFLSYENGICCCKIIWSMFKLFVSNCNIKSRELNRF